MSDQNPLDQENRQTRLDLFKNKEFSRGASRYKEFLWLVLQNFLFRTWLPGSRWRVALLRLFGAQVGKGVVIKQNVQVKFPWFLSIGDHSWIGEQVWIDNLANVAIGSHTCLSQGVYLCTGSHNWSDPHFSLQVSPINIGDGAWVCARAVVAPGCDIPDGAILGIGAIGRGKLLPNKIYLADGTVINRNMKAVL